MVERQRECCQRALLERLGFNLADRRCQNRVGLRLQRVERLRDFGGARRLHQLNQALEQRRAMGALAGPQIARQACARRAAEG